MSVLSMVWQWVTNFIYFIVHNVCAVLPSSPFAGVTLDAPAQAIGWANWFVPFGDFARLALVWVGCIGAYYLCMWALRFAGLID